MNNINATLRYTSKPNIDGIRQTILKGNTSYSTSFVENKCLEGQIISFVLKNHTNYISVCKKFWTQPKKEVAQELKNFYLSIITMDRSLIDQAKFGLSRHLSLYEQNYARNIRSN
tara:strand:+ start:3583 stop:3927 length:345 start_codon:yes stop_codon:yes gene_type:complete